MKIGSLFTGYGGLDMAVQNFYGGELAWYSEIDKHANTILAAHYPQAPNLGDIKTINWDDVPPVDILTGGYPCQPFSSAGARKGKDDERHLWPYVRDAIAALRPVVTVLENVDGHRSLGFADVLADIAGMGMSARWGVVRAADAGAPHGRKRIFIIVTNADGAGLQRSHDTAGTAPTRSDRHTQSGFDGPTADADGDGHGQQLHAGGMGSVEGAAAGSASQRQRARSESDAGGDLPAGDASLSNGQHVIKTQGPTRNRHRPITGSAEPAADTSGAEWRGSESEHLGAAVGSAAELGERPSATPDADGDRRGEARRTAKAQADRPSGADSGRHRIPAAVERGRSAAGDAVCKPGDKIKAIPDSGPESSRICSWGRYGPAISRWEQVSGRPAPDPTIPGANGRPRLSPIFVEWMMGLPAGHVTGFGLRPSACLKILGNGVVPQQAALALRMLEAS